MEEKIKLTENFIQSLEKGFRREHSKFITESRLKLTDLHRTFSYKRKGAEREEKFKIIGMYDIREYVMESLETGKHYVEDHIFVSKELLKTGSEVILQRDDMMKGNRS